MPLETPHIRRLLEDLSDELYKEIAQELKKAPAKKARATKARAKKARAKTKSK
jgi:hypothetical protein